jgi:hypothetical protein
MAQEEAKVPPWAKGAENQHEEPKVKKEVKDESKSKSVINKVFEKLGKPPNFFKSTVTNVYLNRYRVNIMVTKPSDLVGFKHAETSDSFFLHISPEGEIVYANPPIIRKY